MGKNEIIKFEYLGYALSSIQSIDDFDSLMNSLLYYFPTIKIMFDFKQNNIYHQYDLWHHTLHTILNLPKNIDDNMLYFAALLHDIGKPSSVITDSEGHNHYYGHPEKSRDIVVEKIIPYLRYLGVLLEDEEIMRLIYYVWFHDDRPKMKIKYIRQHYYTIDDWKIFRNLMLLKCADIEAHYKNPHVNTKELECINIINGGLKIWDKCLDDDNREYEYCLKKNKKMIKHGFKDELYNYCIKSKI